MRVKRFVASNIQEAMMQVKLEMGKDAVILHTRKFKEGGFLGLFSKEFVEITAAVDNENPVIKPETKKSEQSSSKIVWPQIITEQKKEQAATSSQASNVVNDQMETNQDWEKFSENDDSTKELTDMKNLMQEMMDQIQYASHNIGLNKIGEQFYRNLLKNEVEEKLAYRLAKRVINNIPPDKYEDLGYIKNEFAESLCRILKKPKPIYVPKKKKQQVFAFIGPTGVGKTTTIAKLAANFAINNKQNIALITSDTYRIAAVEQLKAVGEIIGIPVEVVFSPQGMKNSIADYAGKDMIFIDTAGRSHKNALHMSELKGFLDAALPDEVFLVLSATTKYKDMLAIVESYQHIDFNRILFTKLDETSTYGPILSVIHKSKKYMSYCTTGQSVPDDIEIADRIKLSQLILEDGAQ